MFRNIFFLDKVNIIKLDSTRILALIMTYNASYKT